jgi:hypothetical protein
VREIAGDHLSKVRLESLDGNQPQLEVGLDLGSSEGTLLPELKTTDSDITCVGVEPDARYDGALEEGVGIREVPAMETP